MNKNAVHQKLDELTDYWNAFTDKDELLVFRLLVDDNNQSLVEGFFAYHQEQGTGLADLFLQFDTPFDEPHTYGKALAASLVEQYENVKEDLIEGGLQADWEAPEMKRINGDYANFAFTCKSFYEYHNRDMENLAVILNPSAISTLDAWGDWILNLFKMTYPPRIRFIILDHAEAPQLDDYLADINPLIMTHHPIVDMVEVMQALAAEGDPEDDGVQFRQCFVAIGAATEKKDESAIQEAAKKGFLIADKNEWFPLKVALCMALGGAYTALSKSEEGLTQYRAAREAAKSSADRGDPEGRQLMLHAAMAEASALIGLKRHKEAALIYDDNATFVQEAPISDDEPTNQRMVLENIRMASYCYSEEKELDIAWDRGVKALHVGEVMDEETKKGSTLGYVGQALKKLTENRSLSEHREWLHEKMILLLGDDWESSLAGKQEEPVQGGDAS